MSGDTTPVETGKHCSRCRGLCPSGTLDSGRCLDCEAVESPESEARRSFALALASRSRFWQRVVWNNSLLT